MLPNKNYLPRFRAQEEKGKRWSNIFTMRLEARTACTETIKTSLHTKAISQKSYA
ncbi:hypothetical protein AO9_01950 [Chlamydia psittaci Mat116]|nr:hypothetical protein AO9_01950 [Chlamydia psittaci Mat116]